MRSIPEENPNDNADPEYDGTNAELPKKFDTLKDVLSKEEADALRIFIEEKFKTVDADTKEILMTYRPEDWDSEGIIEKLTDTTKAHIISTFRIEGSLNPRKFMLLRTRDVQSYEEEYGAYNQNGEILYTAVATASKRNEYFSGQTLYTRNGEGFFPREVDLIVHRNEELNNWEIHEVLEGERLDLIMVFEEIDRGVHYNYEIDQLEDDGIDF